VACRELPAAFWPLLQIRIVSRKFKKSGEFSDFLQMFCFSSGRLGFLARDLIFPQIS
jgi:hypothetical protein